MNDKLSLRAVALFASGVSAVATSFAMYATGGSFVVSSFNRIVLGYLPGWFVSGVLQRFGSVALEMSMLFSGVLLSVVLGAAAVGGYALGSRALPSYNRPVGVFVAAALVFFGAFVIVGSAAAVVAPAVVGGVVAAYFLRRTPGSGDVDVERRSIVRAVGGVAMFNVVAHAAGLLRRDQTQRAERELQQRASRVQSEHMLSEAAAAGLDAEGIKPLIAEIGEFYKVDINPSPPSVDADAWSLSITGLVDEELELSYEDVLGYDVVHRYKTIRCLSDGIDGDTMDTAVWTGCRVEDILEAAGTNGEYAMLNGADDYWYSLPLSDLEDAVLAYGMNGLELPQAHGYPVRLLVPDRWGKLHVKWLTDIEIISEDESGYWEEKGWHGMGPVNAVTKIDRINRPSGRIQICGHAYAGARGVEAVEVSVDGGETWNEATLSQPLPDPDTERQWVYEFEPDRDSHEVYARTIDGEGSVQPEERTEPYPNGATGWVSRTLRAE
ncbi:molybdopterin-dependent oxidoreductase [Natronomonas moolapensis]|nr:molybdopterin-dependent oxidoreductase [Natronomonas moolapensis]